MSKNRIDICKECSEYNSVLKICKVCGCFMPLKTKIENESCPRGKW